MSRISCRAVSKSFGSTRVLDRLDLDVPDGKVVTLLGESGSGKTTLLRLIAGFERPDSGTITIDDDVVDGDRLYAPPEKRRIGFVAQEGNLFPHLTVAKNIAFGLARSDRKGGRVREMLDLVGMGDLGDRYPHELSGGQQQRVALARALAPRPRVVLLDEPFSSLDASLRASLRFDVMRILRDRKATTIFVTHDQSEALSVADLVGLVDSGSIRQLAAPEDLYESPADPGVARFLGEANILPGTAAGSQVSTPIGDLLLGGAPGALDGPATVLVRPEQIVLRPATAGAGSARLGGRVVHREYYGHDCIILIDLEGSGEDGLLRARCNGRAPVDVGDTVEISVPGPVTAWAAGADAGAGPVAGARAGTALGET